MSPQVSTKRRRPKAGAPQKSFAQKNFLRLYHDVVTSASTAAVEEALQATLDLVCAQTGWPVGHAYIRAAAAADALVSSKIWHLASPTRFEAFRKASEATPKPAGTGLPGRVLATGKPESITGLWSASQSSRASAGTACRLRAGFAFPIVTRSGTVGVLEFFSTSATWLDEILLETMGYIGAALGRVFERDRAGRTAEESEHFVTTLLTSVSQGIIVYDRQLRYRVWNKFMEDLTGLPPSRVLGARALDLFPHLAETGIDKILQRALAGETVASPDTPYHVPATGRAGWVAGLYGPHFSASGKIIGVVGIVRDITERRQAQETLRRSEERFRALIEHSSDAIALCDADGTILYASPAAERITDHGPDELVGRAVPDLVHPDDRVQATALLRDLVHEGAASAMGQVRFRHKNGSWRWIEATATNLLAEPAVGAVVVNYRDVTERKLAIDEIHERAALMDRLIKLSETLNEPLTESDVATAIGQGARILGRAERVAVFLTRPDGPPACAWSHGVSETYIRGVEAGDRDLVVARILMGEEPSLPEDDTGRAIREVLIPDIEELPAGSWAQRTAAAEGYRGLAAWPLSYKGRIVGVIGCYFDAPRTWSAPEQEVFQAFCWEAAIALENARLYKARAEKSAELEALFKLSKQLRAASTVDEMYPIIVERARFLLHADFGSLALLSRSRTKFTRVYTGFPGERTGSTYAAAGSRSGRVVQNGMPYATDDFAGERLSPRLDPVQYGELGPVVIVPVRSERETIGTLALGRARGASRSPFSQAEIRMLEGIAEIGGTAVQRARLHQNLEDAYLQIVLALAGAVDARDTYTSDHSERIAMWAETVARAMGCGEDDVQDIRRAARLHDIGKIGIPDSILLKPMALTETEWAVMRRHPLIGSEILMSVQRMRGVAKLVRHHQERWDGTGYPDGLIGEEIPLGARILAVVDAYSAITDDRPYKPAQTHDDAIAELRRCAGTQFDPRVVDIFCHLVRETGQPVR